jgi:transposase-like protein
VSLPRATQAAWIIALAERLQPLINLMDERLRGSGYIRIDETPLQVINSEKAASSEHWMWVRLAGPPRQRIILFDYDASRSSEVAMRLLEGTHGVIQSDGYSAYDQVAKHYGLVHCGCIAHARRKFFEAIKALPKKEQKSATAAHEAVRRIDELYKIERESSALSDAERAVARQEKALPLLESLHAWAEDLELQTLPSGKLGKALAYLLKQWPKLIRYTADGKVAIDTNLAENAIRPFALGRRYPRSIIMRGRHRHRRFARSRDRCLGPAIPEPIGTEPNVVDIFGSLPTIHNYKLCRNRRTSSFGRYLTLGQDGPWSAFSARSFISRSASTYR